MKTPPPHQLCKRRRRKSSPRVPLNTRFVPMAVDNVELNISAQLTLILIKSGQSVLINTNERIVKSSRKSHIQDSTNTKTQTVPVCVLVFVESCMWLFLLDVTILSLIQCRTTTQHTTTHTYMRLHTLSHT